MANKSSKIINIKSNKHTSSKTTASNTDSKLLPNFQEFTEVNSSPVSIDLSKSKVYLVNYEGETVKSIQKVNPYMLLLTPGTTCLYGGNVKADDTFEFCKYSEGLLFCVSRGIRKSIYLAFNSELSTIVDKLITSNDLHISFV